MIIIPQEMMASLEAEGLRIVIITNGHHEIQRAKLVHCSARDVFAHIIIGGEEVIAQTLDLAARGCEES